MKILVIDDSKVVRRIIRSALQGCFQEPIEVLEAEDGLEGLEILKAPERRIDLILCDWNMPRLDGLGFLKQLRALLLAEEVFVIMVTTEADRQHVSEALRWGARDYLLKPFTEETLREKVRKVRSQMETRSRPGSAPKLNDTSTLLRAIAEERRSEPGAPARLPEELFAEIRQMGVSRSFGPGFALVEPGKNVPALFVVTTGEVEITSSDPAVPKGIRGPGELLGESAFFCRIPASITARACGKVEAILLVRTQVEELVRRSPRLGHFLSTLTIPLGTSRKPTIPAVPSEPGLTGRLDTMPIPELIQLLHICHKTGRLRLSQGGKEAGLSFEEGELRDAWIDQDHGESAFYRLMTWNDAVFCFESGLRTPRPTLNQATMQLLMEGLRRLDESRKAGP